ncbi:Ran-binding zinc finger domain-containing protein [Saccharothrix sp. HUAS TT1]|uniref:zinc finger Ran-binding domain-containing protein n=1 Tax=unclassified Saccharothrix TaxID=2593673 RepID=UPI00345C40BB
MSAFPRTGSASVRRVDADALETVLVEQIGRHATEDVFAALDNLPRPEFTPQERVHLRAAVLLRRTLAELNLMDPQNLEGLDGFYGGDNSGLVPVPELSAYAHVQYALLMPLSRLAGSRERGRELYTEVVGNDDPVADLLLTLRAKWEEEDRVRAEQEKELALAIEALLASANSDEDYVVVARLMMKAGLLWECPDCGLQVAATRTACEGCDTVRPDTVTTR